MKKYVLLTVFGCLLAVSSFGQRFSKSLKDTPGMVSYTMRNEFAKDIPGTLDKIKSMGITNIEFSSLFGKTAAKIRAELDKRGMRCTSHGVNYDDLTKKMDMVVQNAKTLGAKYVRLAWIPHEGKFTLDNAKKTVSDFNQIGKQLKDKGLQFVYHNHGFEFEPYGDGTLFDYIVQQTNPDYVGFEMDILWTYFPGQDPAKLLAKYPKRFKLMHLKDLKKGIQGNMSGGTPPENDVALGTGQINLPAVLKAAQKTAIEHFYIEDESPSAQQQVPQSLAYLKKI
ncbi:sugar phosphate isomerase/epimerase [Larkinella arboricola]|uniref:Sugar phosphate isomerase/epimerase n=1 Tax=Larkinella arboricola TaxID=643671 RepID=A0A327WPP5_LARAB|nr:sugar phosphate isomerase/epimerase family protein [Larkinella arboricola]RAJ92678.1 sugar phosphate isomerase/epimerase [Larkinella arboricola]